MPTMIDVCCGRWGWSKAFAAKGWRCIGIDLSVPPFIPEGCEFIQADLLDLRSSLGSVWLEGRDEIWNPDFLVASTPCEKFSVHGMKHFHPDPPYPELGILLFEHTRATFERSEISYCMENVRSAQQFVGNAVHHCGPFYLWGNAVPPLMPTGRISKGIDVGSSKAVKSMSLEERRTYRAQFVWNQAWSRSTSRKRDTAKAATIPPELAACVADYAERLLEQTKPADVLAGGMKS